MDPIDKDYRNTDEALTISEGSKKAFLLLKTSSFFLLHYEGFGLLLFFFLKNSLNSCSGTCQGISTRFISGL